MKKDKDIFSKELADNCEKMNEILSVIFPKFHELCKILISSGDCLHDELRDDGIEIWDAVVQTLHRKLVMDMNSFSKTSTAMLNDLLRQRGSLIELRNE